jgi:amino acid adenylation domain-containing protein
MDGLIKKSMEGGSEAAHGTTPGVEETEVKVTALWKETLGLPHVGVDENFFDLGGTSLLALVLLSGVNRTFGLELPITKIFEYTTVRAFTGWLSSSANSQPGDRCDPAQTHSPMTELGASVSKNDQQVARQTEIGPLKTGSASGGESIVDHRSVEPTPESRSDEKLSSLPDDAIAIIGMTGRFPGAAGVEEFWKNLSAGVESVTEFDRSQLRAQDRAARANVAGYIARRPIIDNVEMFDASFFGIYPREAEQMDPQHRIFLECAWEVLERAGYDPGHTTQSVGVFAGCSMNTYLMQNLATGRPFLEEFTGVYQVGSYVTMLGNDKDFLATRVSYKLNLHGPSITVQSACSTSLVAICQACQSLMTDGCDMALAGAVSITFPQGRGYLPQEGGLASVDGHCRPFDSRANGTIFGDGAAIVLLKRAKDALADGDQILTLIRGFAVNNDGSAKVGYTAPSVEGQAKVIALAQKMANVPAASITYIEAHGTGTPLGDPIEIAALTKAFRAGTSESEFCSLGSAKANVGHLDVAAGATGIIKTVLQIQNRSIPKLLHFEQPNPQLDLPNTPFRIQRELGPWRTTGYPLRAGVSAFGVGGTNAHVVVEEPPTGRQSDKGREYQLLTWSAKTPTATAKLGEALAQHLANDAMSNLADTAYTLQLSRSRHRYRQAVVASNAEDALQELAAASSGGSIPHQKYFSESPSIVFCFPGQGVQSTGMGLQLLNSEAVFRRHLEHCDELLQPLLGESLLATFYPSQTAAAGVTKLNQTFYAQPAIFAMEYSLAQLWMSWGIRPAAMVGHSVGEYVAACLSGVLSLEDALNTIVQRGRLMQNLAPGSMLAVRSDQDTVTELIGTELDLAALNSPQLCVVSGSDSSIKAFAGLLDEKRILHRTLATSHAFHSRMVEPVLAPFGEYLRALSFGRPSIPYVSTLSGRWITEEEVAQPTYWTSQLRNTVRFMDAIGELARVPERIFLEVGPGETLVQMIRQTVGTGLGSPCVLSSLGTSRNQERNEGRSMVSALGSLWTAGANPDWPAFHAGFSRRRVLLPTYPFERKRYWVEPPSASTQDSLQKQHSGQASLSDVFQSDDSSAGDSPMTKDNSASTTLQDRAMLDELKALVTDLSGIELADIGPDISFLELGFDSLFLTQLTQEIAGKYQIKLTFRELMESYATLGALASLLETAVRSRPEAPAREAANASERAFAAPSTAAAAVAAAPTNSYQDLFASQVQALSGLFSQQLQFLRDQQTAGVPTIALEPGTPPQSTELRPSPPVLSAPSAAQPIPAAQLRRAAIVPPNSAVTSAPQRTGTPSSLTSAQEDYLGKFVRNYNQRTSTSKQLTQKHRPFFADGRVSAGFNPQLKEMIYPLVVERSRGAYLWDKDGNRYVDILNGFGAILYGHSPEFIVEAIRKQLELGFPIGPQTELAGECAELIRELTGMERATFCNTGSEAVMGALRLARTVTGRSLVVMFAGSYHGSFDEVLVKSVGGHRSMPTAPGIPRESVSNILVLDYGTPESLAIVRQRSHEIAAVLVEPVQSRYPELRPVEFLREVRSITQACGAALIFDEVVTGFRTHPGGMQAVYDIRADLATYGKVVAGGLPVGVIAGCSNFMDALDGGQWQFGDDSVPQAGVTFYAGTFMRHPLALAAVRASLQHLKDTGPTMQELLADRTSSLVSDINSMFRDFDYPTSIATFSSWFYFGVPAEPRLARLLHFHLRQLGVHIQESFPCFLSTALGVADLDFIREAFLSSLQQMQAGQALFTESPSARGYGAGTANVTRVTGPMVAPPIPLKEQVDRDVPITEPQREILFATQLGDEANCAFNESTSLRLDGVLVQIALLRSLEQLVDRHDALRSRVLESGDGIHISSTLPIPFETMDLSVLSTEEQSARYRELVQQEASTPFDLFRGPLFRIRLVRMEAEKHVLVLTAHHIIFDGWSTNVFYRELGQLYNASLNGKPATTGPGVTFSEYALEQNRRLCTADDAATEAHWLKQFETIPPPLQLPTDRPRPALRGNDGATRRFIVTPESYQAIRKAGARQGCTLFATLLAAYALLIHKLSQQDDVVIGVPMAGQALIENGSCLVGHCVNFLPVRSSYAPNQSIEDFLKQTRTTLLNAQEHQNYTYGTLLHKLKIERDPSRLQLIEIQFNVEQVGGDLRFDRLQVDLSANPKTHVNMDIFFNFVDRGTELWLDCDYNTGLFEETTITRWFGHLETILRAIVDDIRRPLREISLLSSRQKEEILVAWNSTAAEYPRYSSVHRVFEQQATLTPNRIAVTGERVLTYYELNEKANQLARYLQTSGVKPGARIAFCLERSLEAVVSMLAILKTGASYIPIDQSYPAARLSYLIEDSRAEALLCHRAFAARLPGIQTNVICLDVDWPSVALQDTANLSVKGEATDAAYIMYTSGSSGNPKGVVIPHRAVLRLVRSNSVIDFSPDEVFLQLAPLSFDAATFEIWGPLLNGGKLVLAPAGRVPPEEIGSLIRTHAITTVWLTAALFHLMASEHMKELRPLRQLVAGGDALSAAHVRLVCEELPQLRLINGYGPTENTTFTCCHLITLDSLRAGTVPIGKPISNTRVYILDAERKVVAPGVVGELYAAGDGLALGYLNAPELNAEKFCDHIFETDLSDRLYRTGDLARYRSGGVIEFLGRADTQVKVRGYRIELPEIEHALESSPLVRSAVVSVRTDWVAAHDTPGDKRLAAYIVPAHNGDPIPLLEAVRKHLQDRLPEYMQPAAIVVLENLPRTLNGKLDRRALPAPKPEQLMHQRAVVYPRNPREESMAAIWARMLDIQEVGVEDSIFELGGDSLLIFRITTLARQAGLAVSAQQIFQYRTIAAICAQLETRPQESGTQTVKTIQAVPRVARSRPK